MKQLTKNVFVETELRGSNHGLVTTSDLASSFIKWYLRSVFIKGTDMRRGVVCPDDPGIAEVIPGFNPRLFRRLSSEWLLVFNVGYAEGQLKNEHT